MIGRGRLEPTPTGISSLPWSSLSVLVGRGFQFGSGFLFWVVAARAAPVVDVGIAAAMTSGVLLCTQLGLLGTGSAVVVQVGRGRSPQAVLDTAFTLLAVAALIIGAVFLGLTIGLGDAVDGTIGLAVLGVLVVVSTVVGTANICLDQASIVLQRPGSSMLRYSIGGAASLLAILGCLLLRHLEGTAADAVTVFACWAVAACVASVLGAVQLRRWIGYRYRPACDLADSRTMLGVGMPNQILTLTERAPQMLLPVFLAHVVSPEAVAYWYPAWMMAWVVYTAPVSVGLVQFAETVRDPSDIRRTTWSGLRWSLLLGGVLALVLLAGADLLLGVMGAEYADASASAVRILAVGLLPYAVLQAYNALCRARQRLAEGIVTGAATGTLSVAASLAVADQGPTAMAIAWVAGTSCGAAWAVTRLCRLSAGPAGPGGRIGGRSGD